MESKQTTKKSKANVILAKTRMSAKLQGEGDYEAARRYDRKVRKFVQRADNSLLVITAEGVEHLEQNYQTNLQNRRLRAQNA